MGVAGGTIGRSPDRDLVLADSNRWVGREHAKITFRDGSFFLMDTSKNGTYVNKAAKPLHEGQEVKLRDGDELGIGAYEIRVSIEAAQPRSPMSFDPFRSGEPESLGQTPSISPPPDILDLVSGPATAGKPSFPREEQHQAPARIDDWLTPGSAAEEPWTLGAEREAPKAPASSTEPDHIPDEKAFYRPPEAILESDDIWADESPPQSYAADRPTGGPQARNACPSAGTPPPPFGGMEPSSAGYPESPRETLSPHEAADEASALAAFLAGLGAGGDLPADPQAQARLMRTAGLLLKAMTEGLIRVLMGRATFKSELRLEMTAIQSTKNNPFKLSVNPEDALTHLLFRQSRGFLPPLEAAREAFDDIQCHELAMIAGLRAALRALLAQMDPKKLEKRFRDHSIIATLMPMALKAKYWDLFTTTYEEISADAADDFLNLFKDAFTAAYEDQASRLRQARSRGG